MEYRYIFYEDVKRTQSSYTMDGWTLISKIGGYIGVNKNFLWLIVFSISSAGVLMSKFKTYKRDNLAKDVQSHFIRGPWLKQHNFHSKTYGNNSKHHIYDRNMCPKHRDVNWMVYNRVIRFKLSPPEPCEICYFGQYDGF